MSSYRLSTLLAPRSIAVVGASARPGSVGGAILMNIRDGGFKGAVYAVHPRSEPIEGVPVFQTISAMPETPDVIVLATPARTIPELVEEAGAKGVAAAIIVTAGLGRGPGSGELPGLEQEDVEINYAVGVLTIRGEKKAET
jgi:acetyltransferase